MASRLHLHIGLHKTATTHLQDSLLAATATLRRHDVGYVGRDEVQRTGLLRYIRAGEFHRWGLTERLQHRSPESFLRSRLLGSTRGCERVVISEERVLGRAVDLIEGVYPNLETYLTTLRSIMGDDAVLYLSLRNQADVLPSAYCQALRSHSSPRPFAAIADDWVTSPPRWTTLIERIRNVMLGVQIKVWTYEQYVADPMRVMSALTGLPSWSNEAPLARPERTARLSAPAVAHLESLQGETPQRVRAAAAEAVHLSGDPFDPLSDDDKRALRRAYDLDMAEIKPSEWLIPN